MSPFLKLTRKDTMLYALKCIQWTVTIIMREDGKIFSAVMHSYNSELKLNNSPHNVGYIRSTVDCNFTTVSGMESHLMVTVVIKVGLSPVILTDG